MIYGERRKKAPMKYKSRVVRFLEANKKQKSPSDNELG